jgi:hypothetical protein
MPIDSLEDELAAIDSNLKEIVANNPQREAHISANISNHCSLQQSINGFDLLLHSKRSAKRKGLRDRSRRKIRLQRKTRGCTRNQSTMMLATKKLTSSNQVTTISKADQ